MWPPASPDLNPLDFNIWSILEAEACAKTHDTVEVEGEGVSGRKPGTKYHKKSLVFQLRVSEEDSRE